MKNICITVAASLKYRLTLKEGQGTVLGLELI
jgi:hypothetical protein